MDFDLLSSDTHHGPLIEVRSVFPIAVVGVMCPAVRERQAMLLSDELSDAARRAGWLLAVSFERVEHLTSACLNMLVDLHTRCRHNAGSLVVFGLPGEVRQILKVTRLDACIQVASDADHAREILMGSGPSAMAA